MVTLPEHRGRGCARLVVVELLHWFDHETAAPVLDLIATADGMAMYRSLGFTEPDGRALRRARG